MTSGGPIFLIGAARSGTKLARDLLAEVTHVPAVPYDVNYIWRRGNEAADHDELDAATLSTAQRASIREGILKYADDEGRVIEKTVGNCLRVEFVADVFPEAQFVHLVRDGHDVIASTIREWNKPSDFRYLLRKARHFPFLSAPRYAWSYLRRSLRVGGSEGTSVRSWGPRYDGIVDDLATLSLVEVCAHQWVRSVEMATETFDRLGIEPQQVRYEDLVARPGEVVPALAEQLGLSIWPADLGHVTTGSVGAGKSSFTDEERAQVEAIAGDLLDKLGYGEDRPFSR